MIPKQVEAGDVGVYVYDPDQRVNDGDLMAATGGPGLSTWQYHTGTRQEFVGKFIGTAAGSRGRGNMTPDVPVDLGGKWKVEVTGPVAVNDYLGPVAGGPQNAGFVLEVVANENEATHQATEEFAGPGNGQIEANQRMVGR